MQELRAFDWVGLLFYFTALAWICRALIEPLLVKGQIPSQVKALFSAADLLILPINDEQIWNASLALVLMLTVFVVFVYVRNYIVMQAIDDRLDGQHEMYYFVDYNRGGFSLSERWVRALIVLWVMISPIGLYYWVSINIWTAITDFGIWVQGPIYADHAPIQLGLYPNKLSAITYYDAFVIHYGFVIAILFMLFFAWDVINIASCSKQIGREEFAGVKLQVPRSLANRAERRNVPAEILAEFNSNPMVCSLLAYLDLRRNKEVEQKELGPGQQNPDPEKQAKDTLAENIRKGRLLLVYVTNSNKFVERVTGFLIGIFLFYTPLITSVSEGLLIPPIAALLGIYMWTAIKHYKETLGQFLRYAFGYWIYQLPGAEPLHKEQEIAARQRLERHLP